MIATRNRLEGIGTNDATILARAALWRDIPNRRDICGWSGGVPAP
jgi:hypothetical protein